eukprot:COSAG01_NODE_5312_length_4341_cov_18.144036_6_plen_101_part_00
MVVLSLSLRQLAAAMSSNPALSARVHSCADARVFDNMMQVRAGSMGRSSVERGDCQLSGRSSVERGDRQLSVSQAARFGQGFLHLCRADVRGQQLRAGAL